jgi:DNA-binding IclR family transcriptional regulator
MTDDAVADEVRDLIHAALPSMDHVEVLLALFHPASGEHELTALAESTRLSRAVLQGVLADLEAEGLAVREGTTYRFGGSASIRAATAELEALYHSRPVTLVRAIYARPARVSSLTEVLRPRPVD